MRHLELLLANGGRVEIVPIVEGFSTTNIVKKLTQSAEPVRHEADPSL